MRQKNKNGGRHWRVSVCLLLTGSLVLLMLVLIFWFSAQDATKSSDLSGGISEKIARALGWLMAPGGSREELNRWSEWLETPVRKLAHFTEYMVLSVLTCLHGLVIRIAVGKRTVCYKNRREALYGFLPLLATAVIFCVCYAMTDELHQYFVPGRSCRLFDVGVDSLGVLVGAVLFLLTVRTQKVKIWIKWMKGPENMPASQKG